MAANIKKRTLDAFFAPKVKRVKAEDDSDTRAEAREEGGDLSPPIFSTHPTYPFPILDFPPPLTKILSSLPSSLPQELTNQPHLNLLLFQPYFPKAEAKQVFNHLRRTLPFYRVEYTIKRGSTETQIKTPRYTTVFGLDETATFSTAGIPQDAKTTLPLPAAAYATCTPRPLPASLAALRASIEAATQTSYNFCLVNYYASGADSIAYHSDDEAFLGKDPTIASFSLGAARDFLMKHKAVAANDASVAETALRAEVEGRAPLKLVLGSGDCVVMRGETQKNWLHSIPKRTGRNEVGGRINITFRRAVGKGGTANYYRYNVGDGRVFRWDEERGEMRVWVGEGEGKGS